MKKEISIIDLSQRELKQLLDKLVVALGLCCDLSRDEHGQIKIDIYRPLNERLEMKGTDK